MEWGQHYLIKLYARNHYVCVHNYAPKFVKVMKANQSTSNSTC